ncbi:MAG: hypothetical protein HC880_13870 [Bacteroidia bacterium]|nr:hypothetical protein [Bacteroidia bacterium]
MPNQLKKPVQNPTMRWVFALMKGIHGLYLQGQEKPLILNLSDLHQQIIAIFGEVAKKYYQIE